MENVMMMRMIMDNDDDNTCHHNWLDDQLDDATMTETWRPADKEWRTGGIQKNEGRGKPLSA